MWKSRDRPLYDGLGLKGSGLETRSQEGLKSDRQKQWTYDCVNHRTTIRTTTQTAGYVYQTVVTHCWVYKCSFSTDVMMLPVYLVLSFQPLWTTSVYVYHVTTLTTMVVSRPVSRILVSVSRVVVSVSILVSKVPVSLTSLLNTHRLTESDFRYFQDGGHVVISHRKVL